MKTNQKALIALPMERIVGKIFMIRGVKVMIDVDLAALYGVSTKRLNEQVKRNTKRFPEDFMWQLTYTEAERLRSQFATSNIGRGGRRYRPLVFTEQGVAMLSTVLNSDRAIEVNIQIMRTFTKLRQMLTTNEQLRRKVEAMEKKYDKNFAVVFQVMKQLMKEEESPKELIGFKLNY